MSHDCSACILKDGEIEVAVALERIVRVQRAAIPAHHFPREVANLVDYCLSAVGLRHADIDFFVGSTTETSSDDDERTVLWDVGYFPRERIYALPHPNHHLAHASASFYTSGYSEAPALVIDSYGSLTQTGRESETAFYFKRGEAPRTLFKNERLGSRVAGRISNGRVAVPETFSGIGEIYRLVTLLLGFRQRGTIYDDAGKTMGLASYGERLSEAPIFIKVGADGALSYDGIYDFLLAHNLVSQEDGHSYLNVRAEGAPYTAFHKALAHQVQWEFEEACLSLVRRTIAETGADTISLGGGAFLNSVLNYRILREELVKDLFVFPAATDDGNSVGAAAYVWNQIGAPKRGSTRLQSVLWGRTYGANEIEAELQRLGLKYEKLSDDVAVSRWAAERISAGGVIGWFQGGAELGPRALGNRSILANPCLPTVKDDLNAKVKFRESFRPFGGSVLAEKADEYFDTEGRESPFMLLVCPVREAKRDTIPGVTHVDNTCRIQTVSMEQNSMFYGVIREFENITGVPILLNTSFNLRGMPIVETPADALHCFMSTQMDGLVMGSYVVQPPEYEQCVPLLSGADLASVDHKMSPTASALLCQIDGKKTVGVLASSLRIDMDTIVGELLAMYRQNIIEWTHVGKRQEAQRARMHYSLA